MTLSPPLPVDIDDGPAIAELHRLHAVQREAFLADPYPARDDAQGATWRRWPGWCSATATRSGRR